MTLDNKKPALWVTLGPATIVPSISVVANGVGGVSHRKPGDADSHRYHWSRVIHEIIRINSMIISRLA